MSKRALLEICIDTIEGAIAAAAAGADRIEVCGNLTDGGTTPSLGLLESVRQHVDLDLIALIRPRAGDFLYTDHEFAVMQRDIDAAKHAQAQGIAVGLLTADGNIDSHRMHELVERARPMQVTCHRAFDMTRDALAALEVLVELGVERVLTSGQQHTAAEGTEKLAQLVERAGDRILVMPGGGVRAHNVRQLVAATHATEVHASARERRASAMSFQNPACSMSTDARDEFQTWATDRSEVSRIAAALRSL